MSHVIMHLLSKLKYQDIPVRELFVNIRTKKERKCEARLLRPMYYNYLVKEQKIQRHDALFML